MAQVCFPFTLVFASLLLLALHPNAAPTSRPDGPPPTFNSSSDAIVTHCYTPAGTDTPGIQPVDLKACKDALAVLVHTPSFTTRFRFSKNPRAMAVKVPTGWQLGTDANCRIIVNCQNDRDAAIFRYADVARIASRIINNCVDRPDPFERFPMLIWGGVDGINGEETFYVAVARPLSSALEVEMVNQTMLAGGGPENPDGGIDSS